LFVTKTLKKVVNAPCSQLEDQQYNPGSFTAVFVTILSTQEADAKTVDFS